MESAKCAVCSQSFSRITTYRSSSPSGENVFFEAKAELLRDKDHTVLSMSGVVMILPTCHSANELR